MPRIVCFGSINMDIAAYASNLPRPGETIMGTTLLTSPGGKGLNQAVAARRLGAEVTLVGNVGRDANGDSLSAFISREGINASGIAVVEGAQTGAAIILVDARSENAIVVIPGANMDWPASDLRVTFAPDDIAIAQFEIPDAIILQSFAAARTARARTILNAAPARPVPLALLALTDILIVNETELAAVTGASFDPLDIGAASGVALELAGDRMAVVATLGRQGAIVATGGTVTHIEGVLAEAVDTAGAGDCFIGAFASALARGETLQSAAAFANRVAALSVTRKGTAIAMPFADELKD